MLKTILAVMAALTFGAGAQAQDWPTRPVTMIVPYAAGGPVDTIGRVLGARLSELLGQQVIIENVGGAGGMTGSARVAKAAPDGYTLLLAGSAVLAQVPTLYKKPLYDSVTDFTPVVLVTDSARILLTRKDFPASNLKEFIAYAKANQAKLQYGSAGAGSGIHVCSLLLDQAMGTKITHVPYRGAGPAMQDLIAGRLDYICEQISTAVPQVEAHNVKALVLLGPERVSVLPDLPAMRENGFPDFDCGAWAAFVFPKGTPDAIVNRLARAANDAVETPAVVEHLAKVGVTIVPKERRTPEFLAKYIPAEIARWAPPIKASGVASD
jgi:tripartite-type tricarboxylate transporter receptor subunit TctC